MAFFSAIYTMWLREMKRFSRDKARFFGGLVIPLLYLIIIGVGIGSMFAQSAGGMQENYIFFLLPGIIGMSLLFSSIFAGVSVIYEKQFGFLKEMLVAPVPRAGIVIGKISGTVTITFLNGLLVYIFAVIFRIVPFSSVTLVSIGLLCLFMLLIAFSFVAVGLALAARMNSMEGFQFVMSFLVMPLFLLAGVFFSVETLPAWLRTITYFDPLMYGVDGLRGALMGTSVLPLWIDAAVLGAFCIAMILIATWLYQKIGDR